jgi:hypothetical protein
MRQNDIHGAEAGRAFADMLAQNTVLKELDLSSQKLGDLGKPMDAAFAKELAVGISGNGALLCLDMSNNGINRGIKGEAAAAPGKALADALAANTVLTELNLSNNWLKPEFARELSIGIKDNGAISSVNLLKNKIDTYQSEALVSILKDHPTLKSLCGNKGDEMELNMSGKMDGSDDAIMLAVEIIDNGALSTLILKNNRLATAEAGNILSIMLAANTVIKVLDISHNCLDLKFVGDQAGGNQPAFAQELFKGLSDNRAISKFTFSGDRIESKSVLHDNFVPVTMETSMTEADFSGKNLGNSGAILLSAFLPKCT